jgi:hypothetical protein
MGIQLAQFDFYSFETQLNHLASKIITNANQLHIWTNKIIEFRALQMDGLIVNLNNFFSKLSYE